MYAINLLKRPVLITPDEVLFHAATDNSVDARQILQNIIIAEERIIAPALGDNFYETLIGLKNVTVSSSNQADLLTKINASLTASGKTTITNTSIPIGTMINAIDLVLNAEYLTLWNRFLWKLTAEAVDMMCIVPSWLRHTTQGQQKNNPEVIGGNGANSASGDRKDIQFKIDIWMQDRIDPLRERMHQYICNNKAKYPLYCKQCENADGISFSRKTDFVFGIYNDEKTCGCED